MLADGTIAKSGGKVVKNVAGYDLPKLATGGFGTLGVITRAVFRLHPLPRNTRTLTIAVDGARCDAARDSCDAQRATCARGGASEKWNVDILLEGTLDGIAAQESATKNSARSAKARRLSGRRAKSCGHVRRGHDREVHDPSHKDRGSVGVTFHSFVIQATGIGYRAL